MLKLDPFNVHLNGGIAQHWDDDSFRDIITDGAAAKKNFSMRNISTKRRRVKAELQLTLAAPLVLALFDFYGYKCR